MSIVMFCVTLLSVLCVLVIVTGGSVLAGLVIFYLSSGFFVVYFTTRFMNYAVQSSIPALWAGMGRAVNNAGAAVVTGGSIALVDSAKDLAKQLFISRAALYRHISSLNEKTGTKSRIGLIQFYYQQKNEE